MEHFNFLRVLSIVCFLRLAISGKCFVFLAVVLLGDLEFFCHLRIALAVFGFGDEAGCLVHTADGIVGALLLCIQLFGEFRDLLFVVVDLIDILLNLRLCEFLRGGKFFEKLVLFVFGEAGEEGMSNAHANFHLI